MATTDTTRAANSPGAISQDSHEARVAASPVRVGVEWGYPISLVRKLGIFLVVLTSGLLAVAHILSEPGSEIQVLVHVLPIALAILFALYIAEVVGVTTRPMPPLSMERLLWALGASCGVLALGYAVVPTYAPSVGVACASPLVAGIAIFLHRKWVDSRAFGEDEVPAVLFAGTRDAAEKGVEKLESTPALRLRGLILPDSVSDRSALGGLSIFSPEDGFAWYRTEGIRLFVVADAKRDDLRQVLAPCAGAGCVIQSADQLVAEAYGRVYLGRGDDIGLIARLTHQTRQFRTQRAVDILLVTLMAPIALLLSIPVALIVRLSSPGPILYRQTRVGRWGRHFRILKFRTMHEDAESGTGPVWATEDDPRITKAGKFLRKSRLDELPQLWNVFRSDMSLVGPRPERPEFVDQLKKSIPFYSARHAVRPGVTGWAQIRYPYGATDDDARRKLEYELFYLRNRSLTFYLAVLLETVKVLAFGRGSR
ncbi:MAG: exopolysaccharide biosynthesis polyprenyl glycosylphosphotransferase [Planctomycetota bacterium]|jgi:exopolysaccharide biosynthesis polyprenyl glycosylphosphotransferase